MDEERPTTRNQLVRLDPVDQREHYRRCAQEAVERLSNPSPWHEIHLRIPRGARIVWEEAVLRLRAQGIIHPDPEIEAGMHAEILAAEYLAGPAWEP
jgi:hypothetical protein